MSHTPEQLQELVNEFKALTLTMSAAAGAGHVGGRLCDHSRAQPRRTKAAGARREDLQTRKY